MFIRFRPALAGSLFVVLDKAFEFIEHVLTTLVSDLIHKDTLLVSLAFLFFGIVLAVLITHGAHKYVEREERKCRAVFDDWRDL